jgi:pyruvate/2-oxoglutarate dehydrogenase complex dihydrolipoamide acyltransferase (E2) component
MHASYHHLTNWGTNSLFAIIDEKHLHPFFNADGSYEMREALRLGLTVDERIADGVYFAKSVTLLKKLLSEPELLDQPIQTPVEF